MGRTVLPFTQVFGSQQAEWQRFRRALRREDQAHFDSLFDSARRHTQAGAYAAAPDPLAAVLLSMLVEVQKSCAALERRAAELERRVARLEGLGDGDGGDPHA